MKPEHKKGKKRPFQKPDQSVESKKNHKKGKIDNTVQNGNPVPKTNVEMLQKINKQMKKQKKIKTQNDNIEKVSKAKINENIAVETKPTVVESEEKTFNKEKEKKLKHLKNKQLLREMNKTIPKKAQHLEIREFRISQKTTLDLEKLKEQLAEIRSREVITKSAKRRIGKLRRKIRIAEAEDKPKKPEIVGAVEKDDKKNKQQDNMSAKNKQKANIKNKREAKEEHGKKKKAKIDREEDNENVKDDNDEDQSDVEEEEEEEEINITQEKASTESGDEDEEDDSDKEDDEETAIVEVKKEKTTNQHSDASKKKRYILFVGNLPYDLTSNELTQHFLSKVDLVTSVRIQNKPGTNESRGIAYVEFSNNKDYEKALSLNHTFLKKRRINVQYAASKNMNKTDVIAKSKKLEALRKAGKLAGGKGKKKSKKGKQKFMN